HRLGELRVSELALLQDGPAGGRAVRKHDQAFVDAPATCHGRVETVEIVGGEYKQQSLLLRDRGQRLQLREHRRNREVENARRIQLFAVGEQRVQLVEEN